MLHVPGQCGKVFGISRTNRLLFDRTPAIEAVARLAGKTEGRKWTGQAYKYIVEGRAWANRESRWAGVEVKLLLHNAAGKENGSARLQKERG